VVQGSGKRIDHLPVQSKKNAKKEGRGETVRENAAKRWRSETLRSKPDLRRGHG